MTTGKNAASEGPAELSNSRAKPENPHLGGHDSQISVSMRYRFGNDASHHIYQTQPSDDLEISAVHLNGAQTRKWHQWFARLTSTLPQQLN